MMDDHDEFRIAVLAVVALATTIAVYHRLRAAHDSHPVSRKREGMWFAIVLRLAGGVLWLSTLAYLAYPSLVQWAAVPLPVAVRWLGVALSIVGIAMMQWTLATLGKNLTDTVETRQTAHLITHGPYRWVRHPYYVTAAMLIAATTLITANLLIGIAGIIVQLLLVIRTPLEEQVLEERFGQDYRDYQATTGRFLPKTSKPPRSVLRDRPDLKSE